MPWALGGGRPVGVAPRQASPPPDLHAAAAEHRRLRGLSPRAHAELRQWQTSPHGPCPLCALGEGGAEHVWMWCPAVALSWRQLHPTGRPLVATLRAPLTDAGRLAALLHQTFFLHATLWGHLSQLRSRHTDYGAGIYFFTRLFVVRRRIPRRFCRRLLYVPKGETSMQSSRRAVGAHVECAGG